MLRFHNKKGFTLVDLIIGLLLLLSALSLSFLFIAPSTQGTALILKQGLQIKLANYLSVYMMSLNYDKFSDNLGKFMFCGSVDEQNDDEVVDLCSTTLGSDNENLYTFDDFDDFNDYCHSNNLLQGDELINFLQVDDKSLYDQMSLKVCVSQNNEFLNNLNSLNKSAIKKAEITVYLNEIENTALELVIYKGNY